LEEELRAHQAEVQAQNEELRISRNKIEQAFHHYADLYEQAPIGYVTLDRQGLIVEANSMAISMLGVERPLLVGTPFAVRVSAGDRKTFRSHCQAVFQSQSRQSCRLQLAPQGSDAPLYAQLESMFVCDYRGQARCRTSVIDVTERAKTEQAMQQLAAIVECSGDAIIGKTLDGMIVSWNRGAERTYGYSAREAIGRSISMLWPPDHAGELLDMLQRLKRGERIEHFETIHRRKDTAPIDISLMVSPVRNDRGVITGASAIARDMRDVTERKRAQQELAARETQLKEAQRLAHVGSWNWDLTTNAIIWSEELYRIYGLNPKEFAPTHEALLQRVHPDDRPRVRAMREGAVTKRQAFGIEYRVIRPDGSVRFIQSRGRIVLDESGKPLRLFGMAQDITERKQAEEDLRQLSGRLLQMQDQERRHIARELHDTTGQNLSALGLNLALLRQLLPNLEARPAKALSESLALVEQCSQEIRTLSYLLHPPTLDEVGLSSALRWYVDGFIKRSGIRMQMDLPKNLVRLPKDHETALFRIVQESLTNIHRHSGSQTASIRLGQRRTQLTLEIRDEGRGPPPDMVDPEGKVVGPVGVGISGMRERVRQLNGELKIEPAPRGCVVKVVLPLPEPSR
jgi:PAS domain S-box-containing protein